MKKEHGGLGPTGNCVCPKCGYAKPHQRGVPCMEERCPNCNSVLLREGGTHLDKAMERRKNKDEKE